MFARAPLCFHPLPLPRPNLTFTLFSLFPPSASLLLNGLRTLSFSVSSLCPALPISSALLPQKPGGRVSLVQPIPRFSFEVGSFLFALSCRLSTVDCWLPANSFHCHSYAKTGGVPLLVIPIPRDRTLPFLYLINLLYLLIFLFLHSPLIHNPVTASSPIFLPLLSQ